MVRRPGVLRTGLVVAAVTVLLAPPIDAAPPSNIHYELLIDCPQTRSLVSTNIACPIRATDPDDIMGSPSVAVDPKNTDNLVLASLHGTDERGPTERSRGRQPFTTFVSRDHGASWNDKPYYPPSDMGTHEVYGEHPQAVVDYWGHVYIGSLYSRADRELPNGYNYTIIVQKFDNVRQVQDRQMGPQNFNAANVEMYYPGNAIEQFWFVHDPVTDIMTVVWNEKRPGAPLWSCPRPDVWDNRDDRTRSTGEPFITDQSHFDEIDLVHGCVAEDKESVYVLVATGSPPRPGLAHKWTYAANFHVGDRNITGYVTAQNENVVASGVPGLVGEIRGNLVRFQFPKKGLGVQDGDVLDRFVLSSEGVFTPTPGVPQAEPFRSTDRAPDDGTFLHGPNAFQVGSRVDMTFSEDQRSVIGLSWTKHKMRDKFHRFEGADLPNLIGPCSETTNPVVAQSQLYIGCLVNADEGNYSYAAAPKTGQIDLFRIEVGTTNVTHLGSAPVRGGIPRLGVREDRRVVLMTLNAAPDGSTQLSAVFGQADRTKPSMNWNAPHNYGEEISEANPGRTTTHVNIQDLMYRERSGVVHVIIKERYDTLGITIDNPLSALQPHYRKRLLAIDEVHGVLAGYDFDIGRPQNRTALRTDSGDPEAVFNDLTDDIFQLPPGDCDWDPSESGNCTYVRPSGEPVELGGDYVREFFAVGDYGNIIFGELIEITDLRVPPVAPGSPPPTPIAASTLATTAARVGIGALAVALTGVLALKMVLARRTNPAAAITKAGK